MSDIVDLWPLLLSCRQIDAVDEQLAQALGLDPVRHKSAGLVTCDQDDAMYISLDHATKLARVDVVFAKSFYGGAKHASGPFSGEVLGIVAGTDPDEVSEGLFALSEHLHVVRFQTFAGDRVQAAGAPAFLAHVITETGTFLSAEAGIALGDPLAYLIAPPLESVLAIDTALKVAGVRLAKYIAPPSETNFGGAFLSGSIASLEAARDAFVDAVRDVMLQPLASARRPDRMRR